MLTPRVSGAATLLALVIASAGAPNVAQAQKGVIAEHGPEPLLLAEDGINIPGAGNPKSQHQYTLKLNAQPSAEVRVRAVANPGNAVIFSTTQVLFTPGDWSNPKPITVTARDDSIDNPRDKREVTISHSITSSDSGYSGLPASTLPTIDVVVIDDEVPPVSCPSPGTREHACNLGQSATDTLNVGYDSFQTLQLANAFSTGDNAGGYTLDSARVNFGRVVGNPGDLTVAIHEQSGSTVGAMVANGELSGGSPPDDGPQTYIASNDITLNANATYYLVLSAPHALTSGDNLYQVAQTNTMQTASEGWSIGDSVYVKSGSGSFQETSGARALHFGVLAEPIEPSIAFSPIELILDEAGANSIGEYTIALEAAPSEDVVITLTSRDTTIATVPPEALTFTTGNWDRAQTVRVTAMDDDFDNAGDRRRVFIDHAASGDPGYAALNLLSISIIVVDDEETPAGIAPMPAALSLNETGDDASGTYTIELLSAPTAEVAISLTSDDTSIANVEPASLIFTALTWNTAKSVSVIAMDDNIDNPGNLRVTEISHAVVSSVDARYAALIGTALPSVMVTVADDDDAPTSIPALRLKLRVFLESALP